ncbi:S9 family peptidase [Shewanella sp. MBTL60-007]|uniref:alpha/beta hydrolase family protein n=1 Tax=Shewanella sp. MBTL60-007 TaxID=2815911 RepID=UPI001BBD5BF0|nr:alpha/beta fold hydrolase [Shewanella sp. MBTL60-007]GIU14114.1 peptidase S9 [Shewanella sp. MBTL60-007]
MHNLVKTLFLAVLLVAPAKASKITATHFSKLKMIESAQVSPNGKSIVAIYNTKNGPQVVLSAFGNNKITPLAQLKKAKDRVDYVRWSGDKYVLIGTSYPGYYRGIYYRVSRLYSIDVQNKEVRELTHKRLRKSQGHKVQSYQLLSSLPAKEDQVIVSTYDSRDKAYSVFTVDLENGDFEKEFANKYDVSSWYPDINGTIRLGIAGEKRQGIFDDKGHFISTWYRKNANEDFKLLHKRKFGVGHSFNILSLSDDGTKAYVMSDRETGRQALWLYDIEAGEFSQKVFGHDTFDLSGGLENGSGELVGVVWKEDFMQRHYFDEKDSQLLNNVQAALPGYEVSIASKSDDDTKVLAYAIKDNSPGKYFWLDLTANKGGIWFSQYPQLENVPLATVQPTQYPASDGVMIPAYLTMPNNLKPGEKPAFVVLPHGGPHARDMRYFDPLVQLIASQGYAVLQMNFRGSEGYGTEFETAGYYQWGKRMQQDVMDGVAWLDKQNIVAKNACIVGASYGGYVALTAAFQDSERFDCVVSIAGISDLKEMIKDEERLSTYVDNIVASNDSAALKALDQVSAIKHIDQIKAPILLIHGTRDTRVNYSQSKDFYNQAKSKLDIKYIEFEDGTHFLDDPKNRKVAFDELSEFLDKHL